MSHSSSSTSLDSKALRSVQGLWNGLDAANGQANSVGLQWPYRIMAYRAALAAEGPPLVEGPPLLLSNWRWKLPLWSAEERAECQQVMAQAWQAQVKLNAELNEKKP